VAAALWDDAALDWASFDMALLRSTWDYFHRRDEFLAWAARAAAATRLWNPLALVHWNSHKSYLAELHRRGAPVIPTEIVPAGSALDVRARMAENDWTRAVLKPAVSGDAYGTMLVDEAGIAAGQAHADALLAERDLMIQPYFKSVEEPGERCLIHIDGRFSHAVRKRSHFLGGRHVGPEGVAVEAADDERDVAERVLRLAGAEGALYARVDLARDDAGRPCLMELELVEPTLFFTAAPGAAERMADALEARAAAS
jgi:glutathione synthase/RimK-type ligase-like ATP-grasp enzyme